MTDLTRDNANVRNQNEQLQNRVTDLNSDNANIRNQNEQLQNQVTDLARQLLSAQHNFTQQHQRAAHNSNQEREEV